ncbi:hypothetical protein [Thioalkalivibrio sp.]|uniref:hypothetical protein n=1 Tax=Thioalkalivibrio sp. TaxID=2093813 RepID=UPI003976A4EC
MADRGRAPQRWRFFRSGGFDQVRLDTGADLMHLGDLDPKLWSVLSCPTSGLEFDPRTLELLDADGDGHIRVPEILAAVSWACSMLKDPAILIDGGATLPLNAIDDSTPEGARLLASARQILALLRRSGADAVSVDESADKGAIFNVHCFNGDGIVPPGLTGDEATRSVIGEIMERFGPDTDRSGEPGVSREKLEAFFDEARAFLDWWQIGQANADEILPLGETTAVAAEVLESVRAKVDDYFMRCRLATFDGRATGALNPDAAVYAALAPGEIAVSAAPVAALPLAEVAAGRPLPLGDGVNPVWAERVERLRREVVSPLLGAREGLSLEDWETICARLAPYRAWLADKAGDRVASLGAERIRALLEGDAREAIARLIEQDRAVEAQVEAIDAVERLARYHRDLFTLLNNFVSLRDFYSTRSKAIFQAGTLYLDRRSCELCLRVDDMIRHSALAHFSGTYLVYCHCERRGGPPMTIVAGVTDGDADNLMVGRNGIFYDRHGRDWDATVVKLVEHPISVRQAFWSPYKRIVRTLQEQIQKFAASRDQAVEEEAMSGVTGAVARAKSRQGGTEQTPFDIARFAGIFAAIGLAIGAIGTALAAVVAGLFTLSWWQFPLVVLGVLLAISGPSMLLAWLKLRQRNLAPLLDANGWAVNTRARINLPFGVSLTGVAALPDGAERSLDDPYAEKKQRWKTCLVLIVVAILIAAAWQQGALDPLIGQLLERFGSNGGG